ncbi:B-cell receptor CD22 isoform X4 [Xenopus tropicalis]|uniref:B-cell receptor CD22 isoform X4 n=1 Tax=Xenopus tropicalis TaxID=8364 RepID=A0A8J1JUH7_XENTR|nr:B-cell receptor CD22 isoform X4 [Xenopus tropicalis]
MAPPLLNFISLLPDSPKNVAVVISDGKKERKEGDAVSLTCASDANPAANAFTWYNNKRDGTVELREEQGRSITVTVGRGRETFSCTARNPLGTGNSTLSELQVLSAPTGEGLPTRTLRGGGAVAVLVILLALALYLFLRHRKSQKGGESGGRGAEANVQNPQATESPYINVQIKDTAMYEDMKPAESPYTALQTRDTAVYYGIKNSQPTESPYTALQTRDTAVYYIIKNPQASESPYINLQTRDTHVFKERKPQIHQQNRSK